MPTTLDRPAANTVTAPRAANGNGRIARTPAPKPYTVDDWVAFEETKDRKHELRNGVFIEMAGATYAHNAITGDFYVELSLAIRGTGCDTLPSDQRVYIEYTNGVYPDIVVVCGEPEIGAASALYNPFLVVEVLSPSTAAEDRGDKFKKYRSRPTLRHFILVEQHRASVEHLERGASGIWSLVAEHDALDETLTLTINGATATVPLAAIYRRVAFPVAVAETEETPDATDAEP